MDIFLKQRTVHTRVGEEVVRSHYSPNIASKWRLWPKTDVPDNFEEFRDQITIIGQADNKVVGRVCLDTLYYPFAEIENLEVLSPYRGRGIGTKIVKEAISKIRDQGFPIIHLQTDKENISAGRLYSSLGFLPALKGDMLRMVKFLDYNILDQFLFEHPVSIFGFEMLGKNKSKLTWKDTISDDNISLFFSGGSSQSDSSGRGPSMHSLILKSSGLEVSVELMEGKDISIGEHFFVQIAIENKGLESIICAARLLLNHGFSPVNPKKGGEKLSIDPGSKETMEFSITINNDFNYHLLKYSSYQSISSTIQFFIGKYIFWLNNQHKILE